MNKVALITVLGLGGALGAHASVDIGYQSQTTDASGTTAPGTQYAFFGNGGQPTSLAGDFTVSTTGDSVYNGSGNGSYSTVLTPGTGTSFRTGIVYDATSAYETAALVTFQVASAAITSFDVWVLTGDTDLTAVNTSGLELVDGSANASVTFTDVRSQNVWTEFAISGATTSDTFSLEVTGDRPYVAGITFGESPVPEASPGFAVAFVGAICGWEVLRKSRKLRVGKGN